MSHSYKDLIVWQKAKMVAAHVYRTTEAFPRNGIYGLKSQLLRAASEVMRLLNGLIASLPVKSRAA